MLPLFSIFYILGYTFLKKPCKYKKKKKFWSYKIQNLKTG